MLFSSIKNVSDDFEKKKKEIEEKRKQDEKTEQILKFLDIDSYVEKTEDIPHSATNAIASFSSFDTDIDGEKKDVYPKSNIITALSNSVNQIENLQKSLKSPRELEIKNAEERREDAKKTLEEEKLKRIEREDILLAEKTMIRNLEKEKLMVELLLNKNDDELNQDTSVKERRDDIVKQLNEHKRALKEKEEVDVELNKIDDKKGAMIVVPRKTELIDSLFGRSKGVDKTPPFPFAYKSSEPLSSSPLGKNPESQNRRIHHQSVISSPLAGSSPLKNAFNSSLSSSLSSSKLPYPSSIFNPQKLSSSYPPFVWDSEGSC
jgi:hypothetical protein